jgi:hypothetical protein
MKNMWSIWLCFSIRGCTSEFMDSAMREYCTVDNSVFGSGEVNYPNSVIITNFVSTLVPNFWFENIFFTYFAIKISEQSFRVVFG